MPTKDALKQFYGSNSENISVKNARWAMLATAVATCVGTSIFTRYRASQGEQPMLKVFF